MSSDKHVIDCGSSLTIANAAAIHQELLSAITSASSIELKADKVEKADMAGLQIFVALHKEVEKTGGKIIWDKPSDVLMQAGVTLGLSGFIGLSE